ncbi:hypothetical protein FQA47_011479, partial [Oryzias melastigma]
MKESEEKEETSQSSTHGPPEEHENHHQPERINQNIPESRTRQEKMVLEETVSVYKDTVE